MNICSVEVCDGEATAARNMCHAHYRRWRLGKPLNVVVTRSIPKVGQCAVSDCDRDVKINGLCPVHYKRRNNGEADWDRSISDYFVTDDLEERLRHYCPEGAPDECWEWPKALTKGYGMISIAKSKLRGAHIVAWEIANGRSLPEGEIIRHSCDNPPCTNPKHLLLGTHADNVQDKVDRGRQLRGGDVPTSKLTEDDVLEICKLHDEGLSQAKIAQRFNTKQANISCIIRGETWSHLTGRTIPEKPRHVKLTFADATEIRRLYATGNWTYKTLAQRFEISSATVNNVLAGRAWPNPTQ